MAKAAFATWNERIAPVFDVARAVQLVETEKGQIVHQKKVGLTGGLASLKAACLAELGISTLVCGAISRPLQLMIAAYGIQVIAFVAGNLQEIIQAWIGGGLVASSHAYAMPGCCKNRGYRSRGAGNTKQGAGRMGNAKGRKRGISQGTNGSSQGRKGQGRGRGVRASVPGTGAAAAQQAGCVCPQCGHQVPHERGVPCSRNACPQCGASLIRQ